MFGNLKALFKSDEYMPNLDITKSERVEAFLESIKDWDDNEAAYITTEEKEGKTACFSFEDWKNYQKWRFERYFLRGKLLPTFKTDPIEACKQMGTKWKDLCTWEDL